MTADVIRVEGPTRLDHLLELYDIAATICGNWPGRAVKPATPGQRLCKTCERIAARRHETDTRAEVDR